MARRPTHSSGKGLKPKMPSSVGRPIWSANCGHSNCVRHNPCVTLRQLIRFRICWEVKCEMLFLLPSWYTIIACT